MTADLIALCDTRPDVDAQVVALEAAGPDLLVAAWQDTPVVVLLDDDERVVLAVDGARLVQVTGEVQRLLGPGVDAEEPVWWVEVRASSEIAGAAEAARRLVDALVQRHGGVVWPAESPT